MTQRVLVAMSGGVDSSVAAARLVAEGMDVVGVTLHLWDYADDGSVKGRCCAPEDVHDARRVAEQLGIPHYAFDRRELFRERIVQPFVDGYLCGQTPSPCVECNRQIKIPELLRLADRLGATCVATGHYARIEPVADQPRLHRGRDSAKDQSYFLHTLRSDALTRLRFPLGDATKLEVRAEALSLGLVGAAKGESHELCFVPTGRYDRFVADHAEGRVRPGPIVDSEGRQIGTHAGIHAFTLGQRRNLGVALGERAFVVGIDAVTNTVRLGNRDEIETTGAELERVVLADDIELPLNCDAVVRYRGQLHRCRIRQASAGGLHVEFEQSVTAVVPGQFAVFYLGDRVLGGGRIRRSAVGSETTEGCA
jgi:tRNA-specific 2-thiouridylase